mmetsp:Transcript_7341/g.6862  ORF Transcript_7341/g.6862 Transcript_7341/m.6862 type:complete len:142 (-) Transcript_7341:224-649(-)
MPDTFDIKKNSTRLKPLPNSEIFKDYGIAPVMNVSQDSDLRNLYDKVRGISLDPDQFLEIGELVKIGDKEISHNSLKLKYENINTICQEKRIEYKTYQLELALLKKNSANLVGFLRSKDKVVPKAENVTSVAMLSDLSERK